MNNDPNHPSSSSRRNFIKSASKSATGLAAGAAIVRQHATSARAAESIPGSSQRLRIGVIGAGRRGFGAHIRALVNLRASGTNIDIAGVNDVFSVYRDRAVDYIKTETGVQPKTYVDYREMLADESIDAVTIGTPDHWHALQAIDALKAGKHVYCEKPMTHTVEEGREVIQAWRDSGLVMQVGVQSTSSPVWDEIREMINDGKLGKIVQFQTECSRNSAAGMSRHNEITPEMTPTNVDWDRWLGVEQGLNPKLEFDRSTFGQWRCYWPYGYGMFTDLFVHRITGMLKATGLRYPGRVVGGGGIFMEYDDREVTDVASLIADFHEGVQAMVCSTMVSEASKIEHVIRGHHGSITVSKPTYGSGPKGSFDFVPERPQVTGNSKLKPEHYERSCARNYNEEHFQNFIDAIQQGDPGAVNNDPDLAAAAVMMVNLAVRSYREGKVFQIDRSGKVAGGDESWAKNWEAMSKAKAKPRHVPGWRAGDTGSTFTPFPYQSLAGPWKNGTDPASGN
tara:strand:- start:211782 stop:213305 length:1524 start_codon:yes stop_codon:yes gene_type:complete